MRRAAAPAVVPLPLGREIHNALEQIKVSQHRGRRLAVKGLVEFLNVAPYVGVGVPKQPRHYVGAQGAVLRASALDTPPSIKRPTTPCRRYMGMSAASSAKSGNGRRKWEKSVL